MYGTAPIFDSMGLICPVYSYGGMIAVSFTADSDMMPDPDAFVAALKGAFQALRDAVQPPSPPAVGKKAKKSRSEPAMSEGAR